MDEQGALIFAHISMAVASIMPALIMKMVDLSEPNKLFGYRTPWSLKSVHTWRYANTKSAYYIMWTAIATITVQIVTYILLDPVTSILIAAGVLTVGIIIAMVITEIGMRKNFDKEGNPKLDRDLY